jgi:mRNA interferase HigB
LRRSRELVPAFERDLCFRAARTQYEAWLHIVGHSRWCNPEEVKASYPKASILRVDFRLIARLQYPAQILAIRFFGTYSEYDKIDAGTV